MKHPDDTRTLELPGLAVAKRGRGRPRKPDALTPAQRAKRYRESHKRPTLMQLALAAGQRRRAAAPP